MNKKGFTLVELIAVISIIGVLALISIPAISSLMNNFRNDYYKRLEKSIEAAAREYAADKKMQSGNVTIGDLISNSYIDEVKDYKKNDCNLSGSKVIFNKITNTYTVDLKCPGDNYTSSISH